MDGLLIINKPKGLTSHDVVNKVISVYTLSQISGNANEEGILIEYPSTVEANKLYINKSHTALEILRND